MFNVSDQELDGIESKGQRAEASEAFRPMPFGSEPGQPAEPQPMPGPGPGQMMPVPLPPSDQAAAAGAGKALAFVTVGLVAGAIAGGAWGAATGVALVGASRNLIRVKKLWGSPSAADRSEAGKSATLGIFGLGIAGLLGYQAYKHKPKEARRSMTMFDAQSAIGLVLKPPTGFEELYEGLLGTTPIPFVAAPFSEVLDERAGSRDIAENLVRFVPVPLGGSGLIIIPRALYQDGVTLRAPAYAYDLRWRLRTVADNLAAVTEGQATHPFNMLALQGAPSAPAPTGRLVLPAYTSETVTPAVVGTTARPVVAAGPLYGSVSQGVYALADFVNQSDAALGPNYFPPYLRAMLGNELGIVATKASGNWAFSDTGPTGDAAFSNIYGINIAGPRHPAYPGVGIVLITVARPSSE